MKMDVIFETSEGRQFTIEVGFFDTVLEMKEKIQKYKGFPIAQQTLVLNDQVGNTKTVIAFSLVLKFQSHHRCILFCHSL